MPDILKLKTKFGNEYCYENIDKIKILSPNDESINFSETGYTVVEGQTMSTYSTVTLKDSYIGDELKVSTNGYYDLKTTLEQSKRIPLYVDVDVQPNKTLIDQVLEITTLDTIDVSAYKTAKLSDPNLLPENITFGITILGVTGTFVTDNTIYSSFFSPLMTNHLHNTYSAKNLFKTDDRTNFDFLNDFDCVHLEDTTSMFENCVNLEVAPRLNNLHNVTEMTSMFSGCSSLTTVPTIDTSRARSLARMFYGCVNLVNLPEINAAESLSLGSTFKECSKLSTINLINTSKVKNMERVFEFCSNLETISQLDTSSATTTEGLFRYCTKLTTIPSLNISNVTDMSSMFMCCESLTTIPQLDTSNVIDMDSAFSDCYSLTPALKLCTDKVSRSDTLFSTFNKCYNLKTIDLSFLDISQVEVQPTGLSYLTFGYCHSLENLIIRNTSSPFSLARNTDIFYKCYKMLGTTDSTYNPTGVRNGRVYIPLEYWIQELPISGSSLPDYEADCLLFPLEKYTIDGTTSGDLVTDLELLNRYIVRFRCQYLEPGYVFYSVDDGDTWLDLFNLPTVINESGLYYKVLYNIKDIRFKFITSSSSKAIKLEYMYNANNKITCTVSGGSTNYNTSNRTLAKNTPIIGITLQ